MHLSITNINDQRYNLLKNNKEIRLPIAKGCRKEEYTDVEMVLIIILKAYQGLIGVVANLINLISSGINSIISVINTIGGSIPTIPAVPVANFVTIENRIGVMIISSNYFEVPKTIIVDPADNQRITSTSKLYESAMILMNNPMQLPALNNMNWPQGFHAIEFGQNEYGGYNQYYIYRQKTIPLCCEDFVSLLNKNIIQTYDGLPAEIMNLNWNQYNQTATIDYRIKKQYASNLTPKYIYDGR
jgi:hypothetical protein